MKVNYMQTQTIRVQPGDLIGRQIRKQMKLPTPVLNKLLAVAAGKCVNL